MPETVTVQIGRMNRDHALRAALAGASTDWRCVLAAELLRDEIRRAGLGCQLRAPMRRRLAGPLAEILDTLEQAVGTDTVMAGDAVVVQDGGTQRTGRVASVDARCVWLDHDPTPWPRIAVIRNLTTCPDADAVVLADAAPAISNDGPEGAA